MTEMDIPGSATMASETSGLGALAQREALLLRLNDEIDADARAVISDTERCLRDPPPAPPPPSNCNSSIPTPGIAALSSKAEERIAASTSNKLSGFEGFWSAGGGGKTRGGLSSGSRESTNCTGGEPRGAGEAKKKTELVERRPAAAGQLIGKKPGASRVRQNPGQGGAGDLRQPDDATAAVVAVSSPLFRLSERVKGASRASGERERRTAVVPPQLAAERGSSKKIHNQRAAQTIEPPSSRARENSNTAGAGKPSSRESQRGDDLGRGGGRASENVGIEHAPPGIGEEATTRFLKAKLSACQAQLEASLAAHQSSQLGAADMRKQVLSEQETSRRLSRQLQQLQQAKEKGGKAKEGEAASSATLSARVLELERELGVAKRAAKQADTAKMSLEVRLHRALEEVSKQKEAARQARIQSKDLGEGQKLEVARLEAQSQRLERQKMELLSAFKKQLKLIDVLKRQKFHVEAARLLAFTEEDFVKTLDWAAV